MDNDDRFGAILLHKFAAGIAGLLIVGYVMLALNYPLIWAGVTGILFVLGFGLLTTRVLMHIESVALMWLLTPVFGLAWLLFFYLLWTMREFAM
jgi:hypothetical protein